MTGKVSIAFRFYRWIGINPHISRKVSEQHAFFFCMLFLIIVILSFACCYDFSSEKRLAFDAQVYVQASRELSIEHGENEEDQLSLD